MFFIGLLVFIASILMVLVVMIQNSKGGGLDSSFNAVGQLGNVAQSADTVEKATWYIAAVIGALCLVSAFFVNPGTTNNNSSEGFEGGAGGVENTEGLPE